MEAPQLDPKNPIPGIRIFNLEESHRGYRINRMCNSLTSEANRQAYRTDEKSYLDQYGLTKSEKALVLARDWAGLNEAGGNIYFLLKLGFVTGNGLYRMGAQMRGQSFDEFLASRNAKGAR
ncbi:MAG TPA: protocatechuate 3,4-dioxygenase [Castellaniella sp.]|uniref:protocatechuate 3,4-dioxygenase n=1 Tax=Castellaniella sp. TaxID=1955812 RepID=UPI002F0F57A2